MQAIPSSADIAAAAAALQRGELVAFPTETVYGLGADASNTAAVANILIVPNLCRGIFEIDPAHFIRVGNFAIDS